MTTTNTKRFELGRLLMTPGAQEAMEAAGQQPREFLARHSAGDWGDLSEDDKRENDFSVTRHLRILSAYHTARNEKLWIITEADRSATTILLPEEY
jgi:hypothetical protein